MTAFRYEPVSGRVKNEINQGRSDYNNWVFYAGVVKKNGYSALKYCKSTTVELPQKKRLI